MKKPRKTLYDESWNDCCINSVEESDEDDVEMFDGNEVLAHWEEKVAKKQTNGFFPARIRTKRGHKVDQVQSLRKLTSH